MISPHVEGVSFLITVYNKEKYVGEVIKSVIAQKGDFQKEIIVVDDGSTDNSPQIIEQALDGYKHKKIIRQANAGPACAFNVGVKAASFSFVKFIDADDAFHPDATSKLLFHMKDENVAMVIGMGEVYEKHREKFGGSSFFRLDHPLEFVVRNALSASSETLVRRDIYLEVGGCDQTLFVQGESYIHRISTNHPIVLSNDEVGVNIRTEEPGLNDNSLQIEHDRNAAFIRLLKDNPDIPIKIKRMIFRLAAKRAWRWARNINKTKFACDSVFWLIIFSYFPWTPVHEMLSPLTLGPYQKGNRPRVGGGNREA